MKTMITAVATAVLSFGGAVAAQQTDPSEEEAAEGIPPTVHQEEVTRDLVGKLDTDGDGMVSQQEAEAEAQLAENWDQYDENADGVLDSQELDRFEQDLAETEEAE